MLKDRLPLTGDHFIYEKQPVRNDSWDELPHMLDDYEDIIPYSSYVAEVASAANWQLVLSLSSRPDYQMILSQPMYLISISFTQWLSNVFQIQQTL